MRTLDEPLVVFGEEVTEVVGSVTWEGGSIGPGEFDEFGFSARMPDEAGVLEFPAVQTYDSGEEVRWVGPEDADEPAGRVTVVPQAAEDGQGDVALLGVVSSEIDAMRTRMWLALGLAAVALVVAVAALLTRRRSGATPSDPAP